MSELYDCFERPLFSLGMKWLGDAKLAEELVQDVTVRIWKGAPTFDATRGPASSWIFGIARNVSVDLFRARKRAPTPVEEVEVGSPAEWDEDSAWQAWEVAEALASLPLEQQKVIQLGIVNQFTHAEVAEALSVPLGTVKTRMYLGLKKLRVRLTETALAEVDDR
ncbi:MAG: sigma-70 family RNA polymerase sigma factor [Actinomycetota bacterium]|nr:sigma-70 family RNA polymerase sigma factor [Actinomycetota bacterium]